MAADSTTIEAVLQATGVTAFRDEIDGAADSLEGLQKKGDGLKGLGKNLEGLGGSIAGAGKTMTRNVTAPILGIGTAAVIAATEFDTAFIGVMKTIDTTEAGYEKLKDEIIAMSREIPASASEISAVVESAGQLGIAEENVMGFARTMIDMGETTNLTSEDAATAFARFANITGMAQDDFDRLGSTVVGLGNNMATTEAEIMGMAMRLASIGNQVGLSEPDIIALAGAMSSVGINAEAGGSSMTTVLKKMQNAVSDGGAELDNFAAASNMSASEFADAFENDPVTALLAFVQGLEESSANGENLNKILGDLGIKGILESKTLLDLAGNSEVLAGAIGMSADAWDDNTALTEEAELRYASFASQFKLFKNEMNLLIADIGMLLLPAIMDIIDAVKPWITAFTELDEDTKKMIVTIGLVAAAVGPVVFAVGTFIGALGKIAGAAAILASPIGIIVGLFALIVGAIAYLALTDEEFRQDFIDGWDFITGIFKNYSDNMKRGIEWIAEGWKNFIGAFGPDAKLGINEGLNAIFEEVNKWGKTFLDAGRELISKLTFGIFGGLDDTKGDMEAGGEGIAESVGDGLDKGFESVKGSFIQKLKGLRDLLPFSPPKDKSSPLVGLEKNGIMSNIAAGVNDDSSLVDSAMRDALSAPDTDALNIERDLNISSRDLNSRFEHSIDNTTSNEPMALNLNLGGQVYKAFVQNITDQQDRQVDLELAY